MNIYLVQDSDWAWDDEEFPAKIIKANSTEDAAVQFCNLANKEHPLDGAGLKLAKINYDCVHLVSKNKDGAFAIDED